MQKSCLAKNVYPKHYQVVKMKIKGYLKEKCPKASTFGLEIVRFQILQRLADWIATVDFISILNWSRLRTPGAAGALKLPTVNIKP